MPPGECQFTEEWGASSLLRKTSVSHDTRVFTFGLRDKGWPLGLSTCACILAKGGVGGATIRPYTPISTNAKKGEFDMMVKVYKNGEFSEWLDGIEIGHPVEFKHIPFNVKIQHPFGCKKLGILCGGTGITPMVQALHAVLGTEEDSTAVSVLYGSRGADDILLKDDLDRWEDQSKGQLKITHILSDAAEEDKNKDSPFERGFIDRARLLKYMPGPEEDCLIFVCGPPAMYEVLCGPRGEDLKEGSLLAALGYKNEQIIKF